MKPIRIGNVEITPREILFSTIIFAILMAVGIWISNPILQKVNNKALSVVSTVKIDSEDKFGYAKRTNVGDFLAEGELTAINPVSIEDIDGEYLIIKKNKEKYTMHVQTYTTTDSKGHVTVHTRTYWSWDVVHTDKWECDSVLFLGESISLNDIKYAKHYSYNTTIREGMLSDVRYVYYTHPSSVNGLMKGSAGNKAFSNLTFVRDGTIEQEVLKYERKIKNSPKAFFILWTIFIILAIIGFYVGKNYWLED